MIKFNWRKILREKSDVTNVIDRFRQLSDSKQSNIIGLKQFFDFANNRLFTEEEIPNRPLPQTPCLFISHKMQDYKEALRIAYLANENGYDIYLDILDPLLQNLVNNNGNAILIANLIELGLLNSTHLIAVMTPNTAASRWVPYEFGRVKEHKLVSTHTASWVDNAVPSLPEYLFLCPRYHSENDVKKWLQKENPKGKNKRKMTWPYGKTQPLPN